MKSIILTLYTLMFSLIFLSCEEDSNPYLIRETATYPDHGYLWVANSADNTVSCINRFQDTVIGTYAVGADPSRTAVDLMGNCWVGSRGDGTVYFVTPEGVTRKFEGFNKARGIAIDKEGNVWVANSGASTINKISTPLGSVSQQVTLNIGSSFFYGALVDNLNRLWISNKLSSNYCMIVYDISKFPDPNAFIKISLPGEMYGFTLDLNGNAWVTSGWKSSRQLYKISGQTLKLDSVYNIQGATDGLTGITPDSYGNLWVATYNQHRAMRFDPVTGSVAFYELGGGITPHGMGADDEGNIYTINYNSNSITKIKSPMGTVLKVISIGRNPYTYSDLTGFILRRVTLK